LYITIPIVHIKNDLYLFGHQRVNIQLKAGNLSLRIGGGYHTFEEYIPKHQREMQVMMLHNMMKSRESLEWCCEAMMNSEKIPKRDADEQFMGAF